MLSIAKKEDKNLRLESQYFQKKYLEIEDKLSKIKLKTIKELTIKVTDGTHFTPSYMKDGVPFLSATNVKENFLDFDCGYKRISQKEHLSLIKRCQPLENDILMRKVGGGVMMACVIQKGIFEFSIFVSVALIRLNKNINPYYISTFINSSFGQNQINRMAKGICQMDLHLEEINKLKIPIFSNHYQQKIELIVTKAHSHIEKSRQLYTQSESLLLDTLGLRDFKPSKESISIKKLSESFYKTGRLDAEYYQRKYEECISFIAKKRHVYLKDIVDFKKSIEPGSEAYSENDEGVPFLRVADYSKFSIETPNKRIKMDYFDKSKISLEQLQPRKDTILFSKDGSIGEAYCLKNDADFITSGAILHLEVKKHEFVLPDYLTLVLNSLLVKTQADRDSGGSIILHWRVEEIKNVIVPLIDTATQSQIKSLMQESFTLKAESKRLLDLAKQAVETAIEQDEQAAVRLLEEQGGIAG